MLSHRDYIDMFQEAGFEVLEEQKTGGAPEDLAALRQVPIHQKFVHYAPAELAIRSSCVVLRKRCG